MEHCIACDALTGRAGRGDDSLYRNDGTGPYCYSCYEAEPTTNDVCQTCGLRQTSTIHHDGPYNEGCIGQEADCHPYSPPTVAPDPVEAAYDEWRRGPSTVLSVVWETDYERVVIPFALEQVIVQRERARAEAAERERDYPRSVVEQIHRDAHDALGETEAKMVPVRDRDGLIVAYTEPLRYTETEYLNAVGERDEARAAADELIEHFARMDTVLTTLKGWLRHNGHAEQYGWLAALVDAPTEEGRDD